MSDIKNNLENGEIQELLSKEIESKKGQRLEFAKRPSPSEMMPESFISLGSKEKEKPEIGEVIYFDDKTLNVMCRRWNWRTGDFTKITPETKKIKQRR